MALPQFVDLLGEQLPVERIGMVEIDGLALVGRQDCGVIVVTVERNDGHIMRRKRLHNLLHDRGLSRPRAAGYADNGHFIFHFFRFFLIIGCPGAMMP